MINNYWDKFKYCIEYFFNSITMSSIDYVTWSTTIVAGLLALTTIVFSNYNERQIQKSNRLSKEVEDLLIDNLDKNQISLIDIVDRLLAVVTNQFTYRLTLIFFFIVSYVSGLLWLFSGVGYFLLQSELSIGDSVIIKTALFVIVCTFFILPIILLSFNRNIPLKVDFFNRISLKSFTKYIKSISTISEREIFKNLLNPNLEINTLNENKFKVALKHNLPVTNFILTFQFVNSDSKKMIMSIKRNKNSKYVEYYIKSKNKNENMFLGLLKEIRSSKYQYLYVISSNTKELLLVYKLKKIVLKEDSIKFEIESPMRIDMDYQVTAVTNSYYNFQYLDSEKTRKYKIKETRG